jgi:hypothetical protein
MRTITTILPSMSKTSGVARSSDGSDAVSNSRAETTAVAAAKYRISAAQAVRLRSMTVTMGLEAMRRRDGEMRKRRGFSDEGAEGVNGGTNA